MLPRIVPRVHTQTGVLVFTDNLCFNTVESPITLGIPVSTQDGKTNYTNLVFSFAQDLENTSIRVDSKTTTTTDKTEHRSFKVTNIANGDGIGTQAAEGFTVAGIKYKFYCFLKPVLNVKDLPNERIVVLTISLYQEHTTT